MSAPMLKTSPCAACPASWAGCEMTCEHMAAVEELVEHAHEAADGIRGLHRITDADRREVASYTCDGIRNAMFEHCQADLDADVFMAACGCRAREAVAR